MNVDEAGGGMGLASAAKGLVPSNETESVGLAMAKSNGRRTRGSKER